MSLKDQLERLLGDFSHLSARINHVEFDTSVCGERVHVRCTYPSFREGSPTLDDFLDVLGDHIVPFCIPRSEIKKVQDKVSAGDYVAAGVQMTRLAEKARNLFIKAKKGSHRSGEAGEIALYLATEWLLKAPQIVSKMYLKTNNNMPVYGTDGIHARYDDQQQALILYWGESKAHATLNSALSSALSSIGEFLESAQDKREIEIISDHSDFFELSETAKEAILDYLDPYSKSSNKRIATFSCMLIYEHPISVVPDVSDEAKESAYIKDISSAATEFITGLKSKLRDAKLDGKNFEFFLLPVQSVQGFRDRFQAKIGWPKE